MAKTRKRGRPLGQPSKARTEAVLVKLHADEKVMIARNAGGKPVATYMRERALAS